MILRLGNSGKSVSRERRARMRGDKVLPDGCSRFTQSKREEFLEEFCSEGIATVCKIGELREELDAIRSPGTTRGSVHLHSIGFVTNVMGNIRGCRK